MSQKLVEEILQTIVLIPGIYGLTQIDFAKGNYPLQENDLGKALSINAKNDKFCDLSIAIIVKKGISAKSVSLELNSTINNIVKKQGLDLENLNIYIRGIR